MLIPPGPAAGQVAASRHPGFQAGDCVAGFLSWSEYHVAAGGQGLAKVEVDAARPLSYYLGLLGMPGALRRPGLGAGAAAPLRRARAQREARGAAAGSARAEAPAFLGLPRAAAQA